MENTFTKRESIKYGWETMKSNFAFFVVVVALLGVVAFISSSPLAPVGIIAQIFLGMGIIRVALNFIDHKKAKVEDLYSEYKKFFDYFATWILYGLIVFAGTILLIIPGIVWGIKYSFARYLVIDKGLRPMEALKMSGKMTYGRKWDLFLLVLLLGIINFAGFLLFTVGLFATIPVSIMAYAYAYRKLAHAQFAAGDGKSY